MRGGEHQRVHTSLHISRGADRAGRGNPEGLAVVDSVEHQKLLILSFVSNSRNLPPTPLPPRIPPQHTHVAQQGLEAVDQDAGVALPPRRVLCGDQRQLRHLRPKHAADGSHHGLALHTGGAQGGREGGRGGRGGCRSLVSQRIWSLLFLPRARCFYSPCSGHPRATCRRCPAQPSPPTPPHPPTLWRSSRVRQLE